jgi:hypothetical protein
MDKEEVKAAKAARETSSPLRLLQERVEDFSQSASVQQAVEEAGL